MDKINLAPAFEVTSIDEHLSFDALHTAEQMTRKSYKGDEQTKSLGLLLAISANQNKEKALKEADDTSYGSSLEDYLRIITKEGFKEVLRLPFKGDGYEDTFFVFWHEDGLLLRFDTYWGNKVVNGGNVYFNWRGKDHCWPSVACSGGCTEKDRTVFVGNFDARVALRHNLRKMREEGEFLPVWIEKPFMWLLHYMDTKKEYDHEAINKERLSMLPPEIVARLA